MGAVASFGAVTESAGCSVRSTNHGSGASLSACDEAKVRDSAAAVGRAAAVADRGAVRHRHEQEERATRENMIAEIGSGSQPSRVLRSPLCLRSHRSSSPLITAPPNVFLCSCANYSRRGPRQGKLRPPQADVLRELIHSYRSRCTLLDWPLLAMLSNPLSGRRTTSMTSPLVALRLCSSPSRKPPPRTSPPLSRALEQYSSRQELVEKEELSVRTQWTISAP